MNTVHLCLITMAPSAIYFEKVVSLLLAWIASANESWTLSIENYTDPFIFQAGRPSDINFSLANISQNQTVNVGLSKGGGLNLTPLCVLTISSEKCTANNDTCLCALVGQSGRQYKLTKTFTESDSGQWFFFFWGIFKPTTLGFNVTVKKTKQTSATTEKGPEHPRSGVTTEGTSFSYHVTEGDSAGDNKSSNGSSNSTVLIIAGAGGAGFVVVVTVIIVIVLTKRKRTKKSVPARSEGRRRNENDFEEHINTFYGVAGETVHMGHPPTRNGNSRDASDQSVGQNNEYVRIHNDGSPAVHRPVHPHDCCAADRCRHREDAAAGASAPVDVYSAVEDNKRRKNPSHSNENASTSKLQYKRPKLDDSSDQGEVYASVDKTKGKNTPPVRTAVDDDVYASVDKNKGKKPAGAKKDKKKPVEVLHMDGRKGACAMGAVDADEIVMYDNPCFLEGAANLEETGEIYINLDEKIKLSHPDVEEDREQRFQNTSTADDPPRLKSAGSRKVSRENVEIRTDD